MPQNELVELREEIESLIESIRAAHKSVRDAELEQITSGMSDVPKLKLSTKKVLSGHIHKVNSVDFSGDSRHLVTGSLDGKLIIWDTWNGQKIQIISMRSSWVINVAYATSGNYVAHGGMDNLATIYNLNKVDASGATRITWELGPYDGFLSCLKFIGDNQLVTGSGDTKVTHWDLVTGKLLTELYGHDGDVISMSVHPTDENIVLTGSVDKTAKIWDLRTNAAQQTFWGHDGDISSIYYHRSALSFSTASEDNTARLFDIRAGQEVAIYRPVSAETTCLTSHVVSKSGRYLIAGADDNIFHVWDTLKVTHLGVIQGHEDRITSLAITDSGVGIASASWDQNVRVWI